MALAWMPLASAVFAWWKVALCVFVCVLQHTCFGGGRESSSLLIAQKLWSKGMSSWTAAQIASGTYHHVSNVCAVKDELRN